MCHGTSEAYIIYMYACRQRAQKSAFLHNSLVDIAHMCWWPGTLGISSTSTFCNNVCTLSFRKLTLGIDS